MKIVVAIDGEDSAKSALAELTARKYGSDTQVHLVHVIVPGFADVSTPGIPDNVAIEKAEEKTILEHLTASLKATLNITATSEISEGEVAQVIADACKKHGADEAIVPSHARHGFSRLWFGSVADEIVDAAPCTVVVLKMPQTKA
ncbi:MAG: universal stress protein [Cyanobacteria bacterium SZAS LIN-3]|nr:universal stress protein [Cyanobacteria bacterium SZAS LIN-3]